MTSGDSRKPSSGTNDSLSSVRQYWEKRVAEYSDDCAKVEAGHRGQIMRFQAFATLHDLNGASILDVGSGTGDFFGFLQSTGVRCNYLGTDISHEMVKRSSVKFPKGRFISLNLLEEAPQGEFDYVVSFAIHNVKVDSARDLLEAMTRRQFELCRKAAHVSILTDRYKGFADHIKAWRAEEVLSMALDITPYVILRHDYLPNDFSVTLYREPLIDTRRELLLE